MPYEILKCSHGILSMCPQAYWGVHFIPFFLLVFQKPDDDEMEILNHEEDFCLPSSFFVKEEP